jgi:hypothetical protein
MRRTARRTSRRVSRRQSTVTEPTYADPAPQQQYAPPPPPAAPAAPAQSDMAAELKRLGDLHSQGILTDEEFAAAKAKLLDT